MKLVIEVKWKDEADALAMEYGAKGKAVTVCQLESGFRVIIEDWV